MKRFRFALQPVLTFRKTKADQVASALADRQRSRRVHEEQLRALRASSVAVLAELAAGGDTTGEPRPSVLPDYQVYLLSLREQIRVLEAQVAEAQAEEARLRQDLAERMKEERIIKHLKSRKLKTYESALVREQQEEIDEVARAGWTAQTFGEAEA